MKAKKRLQIVWEAHEFMTIKHPNKNRLNYFLKWGKQRLSN